MGEDDLAPAIRAKARAEAYRHAALVVDRLRRREATVGAPEWDLMLRAAAELSVMAYECEAAHA